MTVHVFDTDSDTAENVSIIQDNKWSVGSSWYVYPWAVRGIDIPHFPALRKTFQKKVKCSESGPLAKDDTMLTRSYTVVQCSRKLHAVWRVRS